MDKDRIEKGKRWAGYTLLIFMVALVASMLAIGLVAVVLH